MNGIGAVLASAAVLAGCAGAPVAVDLAGAHWQALPTASNASLRGLAPLDASTCWCTGSGGTVLRTVDGGASWQRLPVPGAEALDLRSVVAFSADVALVANAGAPARIFRTEDGGRSWRMVHEDARPGIFLDAMVSSGEANCWCIGDPLAGEFVLLHSGDGGRTWGAAAPGLPAPMKDEAAFAASDSCLAVLGSHLWLVTGGAASRCLGTNQGDGFAAVLPLRAGADSQGAFSVAFVNQSVGVAVGGDYRAPDENAGTAAWTRDGGRSWQSSTTGALGYRSATAFLPGSRCCLAVGERGCSWSADGGDHWQPLPGPGFHATAVAVDGSVWAAGGGGRVARLARP